MFRNSNICFYMQEEEESSIHGVCIVCDMNGVGLLHVKNFDRLYAKLSASVIQVSCSPGAVS